MLSDNARAELLQTFQAELTEHCRVLTRSLLQLEKAPEPDQFREMLDEAFRAAHSIKGGARSVGLLGIEALAHGLETLLGAVRRGDIEITPARFDLLYAAVDTLGGAAAEVAGADLLALEATTDLLRRLESATAEGGSARASDGVQPEAAPSNAPTARPAEGTSTNNGTTSERARSNARPRPAETVRVPAARLDLLLEQLGELVVSRLEVAETLAALRDLRADVERWQQAWWQVRPHLRRFEPDPLPASAERSPGHADAAEARLRQDGLQRDDIRPLLSFLDSNDGELVALSAMLATLHERLARPTEQLGLLTGELQAEVKRLRMVPVGNLAERLERTARDLARQAHKEARLLLIGTDTELDRRVLEELQDPLLHLLRNALDHGIEPPAERQRHGKPTTGRVVIAAIQRGGMVEVEVEDDGAGLDAATIRQVALARGLVSQAELASMPESQLMRFIFLPGFSTRGAVSEISGRGVGLDVVARNIEQLGGQIDVASTPGHGTRFTIRLPLTLATTRAILIEAANALYAVPTRAVERIVQTRADGPRLRGVGGRPVLEDAGGVVPVVALADLLQGTTSVLPDGAGAYLLALVTAGAQRVALVVDRVVDDQEIVVKPLGFPLVRVPYFAGATILGSGRVVPILNPGDLVRAAPRSAAGVVLASSAASGATDGEVSRRTRVLVADDSLTARTLERYILEAAGYEVDLAHDGAQALARLTEREYDVLISDVDMPILNGIALTERLRAMPRFRELPVILVTSLASPEDRARGLQAGADAYIVKSAFDQDYLIRTIRELV